MSTALTPLAVVNSPHEAASGIHRLGPCLERPVPPVPLIVVMLVSCTWTRCGEPCAAAARRFDRSPVSCVFACRAALLLVSWRRPRPARCLLPPPPPLLVSPALPLGMEMMLPLVVLSLLLSFFWLASTWLLPPLLSCSVIRTVLGASRLLPSASYAEVRSLYIIPDFITVLTHCLDRKDLSANCRLLISVPLARCDPAIPLYPAIPPIPRYTPLYPATANCLSHIARCD